MENCHHGLFHPGPMARAPQRSKDLGGVRQRIPKAPAEHRKHEPNWGQGANHQLGPVTASPSDSIKKIPRLRLAHEDGLEKPGNNWQCGFV
jgi:hypothetical protein